MEWHSAKLLHSGAAFLGTTRANVLMLLGVCKLLALLDLWVVNAMPRLTCLCVACMMGAPSATYHESLLATNTCVGKARVACQRKGNARARVY